MKELHASNWVLLRMQRSPVEMIISCLRFLSLKQQTFNSNKHLIAPMSQPSEHGFAWPSEPLEADEVAKDGLQVYVKAGWVGGGVSCWVTS